MNVKNMNELVAKLLEKTIIASLTEIEYKDDVEWFNESFEQYMIQDFDFMVTYCNDDGYITDLEGFSKDLKNNWYGVTFDGSMIDLETIKKVDGDDNCSIDEIYTNVYDVQLWRKELV